MTHEFFCVINCHNDSRGTSFALDSLQGLTAHRSADGARCFLPFSGRNLTLATQSVLSNSSVGLETPAQVGAVGGAGILIDQARGRVTVIYPHIGTQLIYWRHQNDRLILGSNALAVASAGDQRAQISTDAIYRYLYFHAIPGPVTIFEGVCKLEGGHYLTWNGSTDPTTDRYWRPTFSESPQMSLAEAKDRMKSVLRTAVGDSLEGATSPGAFLSGGLDSSSVAGLAAGLRPGIASVSMGFDAQGYDEMEYARIASRHFGTKAIEYYVTPDDVLRELPAIAAAFPEPFGNSSAAATFHCARVAREHGLNLLLAGDGGDELFGGNDRYATQMVFERYGRVPAVLRNLLLEPAVNAAASVTRMFPIGKASSYIAKAKTPLPDRLQSYNFLNQHDPREVFSEAALGAADQMAPLRALQREYFLPTDASQINRMLFMDWKFTLNDNDLVKVGTMCRLAGIDVAYPMLDPGVVDFSLGIPSDWKVRNGNLRWFYKEAMADFLPSQIINKTKHGFGLPFGVWTRTHAGLLRISADALDSLGNRGYFRKSFLEKALRMHREGHASYYGELVWVLMVLELWLQAHAPQARV